MAVSFTKIQKISKKTSKKQQIIGPCTAPPISFFLVLFLSYQDERKRTSPNLEKTNKLPIFVPALVCDSHAGEAIKRESGVNPEQSRCCKFHACYKQFTHCHWRIIWEGVCNRNKSEDLPCNYVSLLSRKKR